jgi:hypothetical protein
MYMIINFYITILEFNKAYLLFLILEEKCPHIIMFD